MQFTAPTSQRETDVIISLRHVCLNDVRAPIIDPRHCLVGGRDVPRPHRDDVRRPICLNGGGGVETSTELMEKIERVKRTSGTNEWYEWYVVDEYDAQLGSIDFSGQRSDTRDCNSFKFSSAANPPCLCNIWKWRTLLHRRRADAV